MDLEVGDVGREVFFKEEVGCAATHAGSDDCDRLHYATLF
jgi:hypothetical protein